MPVEKYTADNLVVENVVTDNRLMLVTGQKLKRGRLLKLDSGKLTACNTGGTPHSVLVADVDATSADMPCAYYVAGVLNENSIDYGTGNADEFREALRIVNITTKKGTV